MAYDIIRNIPTNSSDDKVWLSWYSELKKVFGKKKAKALFSQNWDAQLGQGSIANTTNLRAELEKDGIDISGGFFGETLDKTIDVGNFFGDYFTVGKYLGMGLAGIVVFSVGALVFQIATNSKVRKEAISMGTTVASRGLIK